MSRRFYRAVAWYKAVAFLLPVAGCGLIAATGLQTDYSFDALKYVSPEFGDPKLPATFPDIPCDPAADTCQADTALVPLANLTAVCDATLKKCVGRGVIRVSETVDIAKQMESSFPAQAIEFGVQLVEVKRVTYWIEKNTLNHATPSIDIYVAPVAAKNETDPKAALLAKLSSVPMGSYNCADPVYDKGDTRAPQGVSVCSAPMFDAGKNALGDFVKNYKTPFQVIAHAVTVAKPGDPVPAGSIGFSARPTVGLKILD